MSRPQLTWEWGTGYDLFVSLHVLHHADTFGLRSSWAAGVRSRLPEKERKTLEEAQEVASLPLAWIHTLPPPQDAATILGALSQISPRQRLLTLAEGTNLPPAAMERFKTVSEKGEWSEDDLKTLKVSFQDSERSPRPSALETMLDIWTQPGLFGERFFQALQAYHRAFFAEEEKRIHPYLESAVEDAKAQAKKYSFDHLIETLSRGLRFGMPLKIERLVLIPSYWITPLIVYREISTDEGLFLFGGRPEGESLVPGAKVPDTMLRTLKTLADPTRLRILRYLAQQTLSPSQLAKRLRLRASTVNHHLNALRLAGLVTLTLEEKNNKRYATRKEAIPSAFSTLETFLNVNLLDLEPPHENED